MLVGIKDAARDGGLILALGQDVLTALAHHDRGAGVLAHRQDPTSSDVGVLEQVQGHESVVGRGFGVIEDVAQLL